MNDTSIDGVWVFTGNNSNGFPSALFTTQVSAEQWIHTQKVSGTLTWYPLNSSVYEWAIAHGYFRPKGDDQSTPAYISRFTSAAQQHYHYTDGEGGHIMSDNTEYRDKSI